VFVCLISHSRGIAERDAQAARQACDELRRVVGYSAADEIEKLDRLKEASSITDEEFARFRAELVITYQRRYFSAVGSDQPPANPVSPHCDDIARVPRLRSLQRANSKRRSKKGVCRRACADRRSRDNSDSEQLAAAKAVRGATQA
jgi:hypothetical protein